MLEFIGQVKEQLHKMTEAEKNEWILTQAMLLEESEQQGFLMSLTGEKKIIYMPTKSEIEDFCRKVRDGAIQVEYETHYYEFDVDGRYMDDWKVWHNDPYEAFPFLDRVFAGCHDLIVLGDYQTAADILNQVCRLEFQVVDAEDSEDCGEDTIFAIPDAGKERLLAMSCREIGQDWITALIGSAGSPDVQEFARDLAEVFQLALCKKLCPSNFRSDLSEEILRAMEDVLAGEIVKTEEALSRQRDESTSWHIKYTLEHELARKKELLLDIRMKCRAKEREEEQKQCVSVLKSTWQQIKELLELLSYEYYIDDQWQIEEIWNICEALIKRGRFEEEKWRLRKGILKDIVAHEYYDYYSCGDPMKNLAQKLYITPEENLEFADILNQYPHYAKEAARLYRQYGRMDEYVLYLQNHLGRGKEEYVGLIAYYHEAGRDCEARQVAEQGLEDCKEDLTDIFIYLLQDAKSSGETERYKKFYASAKRRKRVDINKVEAALS